MAPPNRKRKLSANIENKEEQKSEKKEPNAGPSSSQVDDQEDKSNDIISILVRFPENNSLEVFYTFETREYQDSGVTLNDIKIGGSVSIIKYDEPDWEGEVEAASHDRLQLLDQMKLQIKASKCDSLMKSKSGRPIFVKKMDEGEDEEEDDRHPKKKKSKPEMDVKSTENVEKKKKKEVAAKVATEAALKSKELLKEIQEEMNQPVRDVKTNSNHKQEETVQTPEINVIEIDDDEDIKPQAQSIENAAVPAGLGTTKLKTSTVQPQIDIAEKFCSTLHDISSLCQRAIMDIRSSRPITANRGAALKLEETKPGNKSQPTSSNVVGAALQLQKSKPEEESHSISSDVKPSEVETPNEACSDNNSVRPPTPLFGESSKSGEQEEKKKTEQSSPVPSGLSKYEESIVYEGEADSDDDGADQLAYKRTDENVKELVLHSKVFLPIKMLKNSCLNASSVSELVTSLVRVIYTPQARKTCVPMGAFKKVALNQRARKAIYAFAQARGKRKGWKDQTDCHVTKLLSTAMLRDKKTKLA